MWLVHGHGVLVRLVRRHGLLVGWSIDMNSSCGSSDIDMDCSRDMLIPSLCLICVLVRHEGLS
ncbi:MAG: hypothetical protein WAL72_06020 [Streptosporangiaceae bacterium]